MLIKDGVFIVTGGASGLGGATARMLVEGGGKVPIADLKEAEGQALAKELGKSAHFARTDVTDEARSEEHTSELQSHVKLVCRLLLVNKYMRSSIFMAHS